MANPPLHRHLILTVHGIRTYGAWQQRLETLLRQRVGSAEQTLEFVHYKYGLFTVFAFLIPFLRNLATRHFCQRFESLLDGEEFDRIDVVAHSFGAYITTKAITRTARKRPVRIHTLMLAGSVIHPDSNIGSAVGVNRPIGRIINDCGMRDDILLLTLLVFGVGMSGRLGLHGFERRNLLVNRYFQFGHGGYFEPSKWGGPDAFMERWWLPLLLHDGDIEPHNARPEKPSFPSRFWAILGENSARTTLSFYAVVVTLFAGSLIYLWLSARVAQIEAERQRDNVLLAQSRLLSDLSGRLTAGGDAVGGILVALEALPDAGSHIERPYVARAEVSLYRGLHARREARLFSGPAYQVMGATFNPVSGQIALSCSDNYVRIFDGQTLTPVAALEQLERYRRGGSASYGATPMMGAVTFSSDGTLLVASSWDKTIRVWDAKTWKPIETITGYESDGVEALEEGKRHLLLLYKDHELHPYEFEQRKWLPTITWSGPSNRRVVLSPDGRWIVTFAFESDITVWDARTGKLVISLEGTNRKGAQIFTFSPDGRFAVAVGKTGVPELWDAQNWQRTAILKGSSYEAIRASFSRDGSRILTIQMFESEVHIWDGVTGSPVSVLKGSADIIDDATFSPDGAQVVTRGSDLTARIWDTASGRQLQVLRGHTESITAATFVEAGNAVLTVSNDNTVRLWDSSTGEETAVFSGHDAAVTNADRLIRTVMLSPDSKTLLTYSDWDKTARIWNVELQSDSLVLLGAGHRASSVSFNSINNDVIIAAQDNTIRVLDSDTGEETREFRDDGFIFTQASYSSDGRRILAIAGGAVDIFDVATNSRILTFSAHSEAIIAATFSPDGQRIATASVDGTAKVWDAATGRLLLSLTGFGLDQQGRANWVSDVAFSPDGARIITAAYDNTAKIWDTQTGRQLLILKGHSGWLSSATFSPDGREVLTASFDLTVRLWDSQTGEVIRRFPDLTQMVTRAVFTPDGRRVVGSSNDKTARVWDSRSGETIAVLNGHNKAVAGVAVSADGMRIATRSGDGTVRVWRLFSSTQAVVDHAKDIVPRCLTRNERDRLAMEPAPPDWCIENEKWPYQSQAWKNWRAVGKLGPMP
jgi:WD40 repeat protein